jgi:NAD(P)-dependent dehydrogenase (short-subunit alcohol dehydrogenase family)
VFVTGGTKGAGEAIVRRFASAGARLVTAARSAPLNHDLLAHFVSGDLSTPAGVARVAEAVTGIWEAIHISSIQRRLPLPESTTAYAAAKAALTTYSKALSKELGPKGVRVNSVSPGWIYTTAAQAMVARIAEHGGIDEETARQGILNALGGIPIGRPAWP